MKEISNRRAFYDYEILEKFEAGIALIGCEVKSLRAGNAQLKSSYAVLIHEELWLLGAHIDPYKEGAHENTDPERKRKLLVHRHELNKWLGKIQEKGLNLIPLRMYFKKHLVKVELGLCRSKKLHDKREKIKERETNRSIRQEMMRRS